MPEKLLYVFNKLILKIKSLQFYNFMNKSARILIMQLNYVD